ncbi:MAG: nucleoside monophosphate kinase [Lactobacillus sp.]|jgi:adenylate kinase|nr:nucleoside monophosphate kinase [Lactobacillus sp.]
MNFKKRISIIGGAPNSGKGSYGQLFEEKRGLIHYSTGDALRQSKDIPEVLAAMGKGNLAPDDLVMRMTAEKILSTEKEMLLDGAPRNLYQLGWLEGWAEKNNYEMFFFFLDVPEEELWRRLNNRIKDFQEKGLPPREDDNPEAYQKRLDIFNEKTLPAWLEAEKRYPKNFYRISAVKDIKDPEQEAYALGILVDSTLPF